MTFRSPAVLCSLLTYNPYLSTEASRHFEKIIQTYKGLPLGKSHRQLITDKIFSVPSWESCLEHPLLMNIHDLLAT